LTGTKQNAIARRLADFHRVRGAVLAARRSRPDHLPGAAVGPRHRVPSRAHRHARWRLLALRLARRCGAARRERASRRAVPRPRGKFRLALRFDADGPPRGARLARCRAAFSRLRRRTESPAARVPFGRPRGGRRDDQGRPRARGPAHPGLRLRRVARRKRAAQLAWPRRRRRSERDLRGRGRVDAARLDGVGHLDRQGIQPLRLRTVFPAHVETQGHRDGAPFPGPHRQAARWASDDDAGIRRRGHGTSARF